MLMRIKRRSRCSLVAIRLVLTFSQVLEYILFQAGLFSDYLASPYKTARNVEPLGSVLGYQNCRTIVVNGHEDAIMTLTTAANLSNVIARTVVHEGEWPEIGGIRSNRVTFSQAVKIGEKIRGAFHLFSNLHGVSSPVDKANLEDLEVETQNISCLEKRHGAVSEEQFASLLKAVPVGILRSTKGAWDMSDEPNQLFPDYKFDELGQLPTTRLKRHSQLRWLTSRNESP